MLTLLLALAVQGTLPAAAMRDTTPGRPVGVPFTRDEYVRAQLQVRPREEAEALASRLFDDRALIGATLMDGDLLLLALLSEDMAARVVALRPSLRTKVVEFRTDRERVLEGWRAAIREDSPPL
jgi:hypothetical protein